MINQHLTHSTPLPVSFRTWLWRYTCFLLISIVWHREAIFESKGDKLSSSAECRLRTQDFWNRISTRLKAHWQTDWAIENQVKNLELISSSLWSTSIQPTRPHCRLVSHLALAICMFVVNFDDIYLIQNATNMATAFSKIEISLSPLKLV